jgi:hypothetical protein
MNKLLKISLLALIGMYLFSGCSKRRIVISAPEVQKSQINTWAQQTNVKEDVDVSDLNNNEKVSTVSRTTITEAKPAKMERVRFPIEEYKGLSTVGNGTVKGSIYLKNAYDKRVIGSNTRLYLNPVTSYSKQWYHESYLGGHKMEKADNRLFNYLRFTSANSQGQYSFYGVPEGRYYLIGTVKCAAQCGYSSPKSIRIASEVSIRGNQVIQRDLDRLID